MLLAKFMGKYSLQFPYPLTTLHPRASTFYANNMIRKPIYKCFALRRRLAKNLGLYLKNKILKTTKKSTKTEDWLENCDICLFGRYDLGFCCYHFRKRTFAKILMKLPSNLPAKNILVCKSKI